MHCWLIGEGTYASYMAWNSGLGNVWHTRGNADVWSQMTEIEVKQLPNYCMVKYREQQGDAGARGEGMALMGPQYSNVHHYCGGLNYLNRYYRNMGRRDAGSYLAFAISEFNYMV